MDEYLAAKKRKNNPSEAKQQVDKARSRTRVNLHLVLSHFQALGERPEMKGNAALACFLLDRYMPNTGS